MKNEILTLEEILKEPLKKNIKHNFSDKFGKIVYYDYNGICKTGTLIGLVDNNYIIEKEGIKTYLPLWKSISLL
jgi:hypothetical protein